METQIFASWVHRHESPMPQTQSRRALSALNSDEEQDPTSSVLCIQGVVMIIW